MSTLKTRKIIIYQKFERRKCPIERFLATVVLWFLSGQDLDNANKRRKFTHSFFQ